MRGRDLYSRVIKTVRIQRPHRTLVQALAAFWTVKTHAMLQRASMETRSWRRQ